MWGREEGGLFGMYVYVGERGGRIIWDGLFGMYVYVGERGGRIVWDVFVCGGEEGGLLLFKLIKK